MFVSKKQILWLVAVMIAGLVITACGQAAAPATVSAPSNDTSTEAAPPAAATEAPAAAGEMVNAFGVELPADAAPSEKQFIRILAREGAVLHFAESVYKRSDPAYTDLLTTPLVRINKNFEIVPAGAESWEVESDGLTWTYHLDKNLKWSDGNPVTADDYVFTFQYQADPKRAWDFAWFWAPIKNWDEAVKGDVAVTEIGVKKVDDYTLQFITEVPAPYFSAQALYARPLSKKAFEAHGEFYDNKPETSVSSSPWILEEWSKGNRIVFGPNKNYTGKLKPYLEKIIVTFGEPSTDFRAYQADEVDYASHFTPAELSLIDGDSALSQEYHPGFGDFRTHYLGFNTFEPPFDKLQVRQALAKVIDRQALIDNIIHKQGMPAYSFLMPGFPDASSEELKKLDVNQFDPAAAKKLLADAGYPDGKDFPKLELWLRDETDLNKAVANAIASMIKDNLGIEVEVSNKERKLFMDELNAHKTQFYMVSYGFDYLDASNMLGVWVSTGRHAWKNDEFDKLVNEAAPFVGDATKRSQMWKDAEKILVEDVGGVFLYHETPGQMFKPYVKGSELEPDKTGVATWHWPGLEDIGMLSSTLYISKEVDNYPR